MENFFENLLNSLPIALVAIPAGWLGSFIQTYFSEKGKNLATKEDIQEITAKIEFVKNQFSKRHLLSKAYIERQISAFDELGQVLHEISHLGYEIDKDIDFIKVGNSKLSKDKYEFASKLLKQMDKRKIFLPLSVHADITNVCEGLFELSKIEYLASITKDRSKNLEVIESWNTLLDLVDEALLQIRKELNDE